MSAVPGFTQQYKINKLIWYEMYGFVGDAISRENNLRYGIEIGSGI